MRAKCPEPEYTLNSQNVCAPKFVGEHFRPNGLNIPPIFVLLLYYFYFVCIFVFCA